MEHLSWETIEYLHSKKSMDWYWIVGAVAISFALVAVILNNLIFGILIIIAAFTLALFASKPPQILKVEINTAGIDLNNTHHPYGELESFWIEQNDPNPKIILKSKKVFMPFITIFIEDVPVDELHVILSHYLKEEKHVEPFLEKLLVYLGF
jgi:hypothetical protein